MKKIDIKKVLELAEKYKNQKIIVCGWVKTARYSKNVIFIELNDGTSVNNLQLIVDRKNCIDETIKFKIGSALKVEGTLIESIGNNKYELLLDNYELLGDCPDDYPLQKKKT